MDFRTDMQNADLEQIVYVINPGQRHKLVSVEVRGNHYFSTETIRDRTPQHRQTPSDQEQRKQDAGITSLFADGQ